MPSKNKVTCYLVAGFGLIVAYHVAEIMVRIW